MSSGAICDIGRASLQLRPHSPFFLMDLPKLMGSWQKKWFYISGLEGSLPAFFVAPSARLNCWESLDDLLKDAQASDDYSRKPEGGRSKED